jgi:hypothetical protein
MCGGLIDFGTLGGKDAATEPAGTDSRHVPQAVEASRRRLAELLISAADRA